MQKIIKILTTLVAINSTKIDSAKHFDSLIKLLEENSFSTEIFEERGVYNLYSEYLGRRSSSDIDLAFVGHLDVVPAGDIESWSTDPFVLTELRGELYGRGVVDMKSSIAAFMQASFDYVKRKPNPNIAIILTGDEETNSFGAINLLGFLKKRNKKIKQILIGEPTSELKIGDIIKNGRRGSVNFNLKIEGIQGHVAYPHLAKNPFDCLTDILYSLKNLVLDFGTRDFQASKLVITSIDTDNKTMNIIPQKTEMSFNIRYNTLQNLDTLKNIVTNLIKASSEGYVYKLETISHSNAFISTKNLFTKKLEDAIKEVTGLEVTYNTNGGTSDGRILHEIAPIIEFGPLNTTAHKVNEKIKIDDLKVLYDIYLCLLEGM